MRKVKVLASLATILLIGSSAQLASATEAGAAITPTAVVCPAGAAAVTNLSFTVNGSLAAIGAGRVVAGVRSGDTVTATFTIAPGCTAVPVSFSSYRAPAPFANAGNIGDQTLFSSASDLFAAGQHSLTVTVPTCFFQIDMYQGSLVTRWDLPTVTTFLAASPTREMLGVANGGTAACTTATSPTVTTTVVTTVTTVTPVTPVVAGFQQAPAVIAPAAIAPVSIPAVTASTLAAPTVAGVSALPSTSTAPKVDRDWSILVGLAFVLSGTLFAGRSLLHAKA